MNVAKSLAGKPCQVDDRIEPAEIRRFDVAKVFLDGRNDLHRSDGAVAEEAAIEPDYLDFRGAQHRGEASAEEAKMAGEKNAQD